MEELESSWIDMYALALPTHSLSFQLLSSWRLSEPDVASVRALQFVTQEIELHLLCVQPSSSLLLNSCSGINSHFLNTHTSNDCTHYNILQTEDI